jgi:hypothetical protein
MKLASPARRLLCLLTAVPAGLCASGNINSFHNTQTFLRTYCQNCHQAKSPTGGFRLEQISTPASLQTEARRWAALSTRVRNREMPPKGAPAPTMDQVEQFTAWVETNVRSAVCSAGIRPGPSPIRRLNRDEYAATLRDLLDIHLDIAKALPTEGAGGEGFDNAAETLFLSPLYSEKYMEAARFAMEFAGREFKSRAKILVARPGAGTTPDQAARRILEDFLPRAFRRPVSDAELAPYLVLFQTARKRNQAFEDAVFFALRGVLVSPLFLFRVEPANEGAGPRPVDDYSLASRLSYFLWGSMPDELLFDVAAAGKLHEPEVLREVIARMLRNDKSLGFAQRFVEQWLGTRELAGDKAPDAKLFPQFASDEELRADIQLQPVLFFREILVRNLSVLNLLDSRHTIGTSNLSKLFGVKLPVRQNASKQPQWVELPEGTRRGGLLGMPAVLAVSSYPYRTSPVLRGAWILDSLLGTPPPPPPPETPALEEPREGAPAKSMRDRLARHRSSEPCASCHSRMDGLGFALENFDVLGRWRDEDGGLPVDNSSELADGTKVQGPDELKRVLLERKDLFLRNLTNKMLGFALGRGLTLEDSCAVDRIVAQVRENEYKAQSLIEAIVASVPFRYQAGRKEPGKQ